MDINRVSSDELSGNNSHFNAGMDESIVTKRSNVIHKNKE
jgi:hypothetical protein